MSVCEFVKASARRPRHKAFDKPSRFEIQREGRLFDGKTFVQAGVDVGVDEISGSRSRNADGQIIRERPQRNSSVAVVNPLEKFVRASG